MPGIGGALKGIKAAFAKAPKDGLMKGTYKNAAGTVKAKPGFTMLDGKVLKNEGAWATIQRNPGRTTAGVVGAFGAYQLLG